MTTGRIGGAERLIADLAAVRVPGLELAVCTLEEPGELGEILARIGVPCHSLGLRHAYDVPRTMGRLVRIARALKADILHGHLVHGAFAATLAGQLMRIPASVITRHYAMHTRWYGSRTDRILERSANALASRIFAISEAVRSVLIDEGVQPSRVEVIPNGIDVARVRQAASKPELGLRRGRPILGTVGSLHSRKGHRHLLHSVAELRAVGVDLDLVLVGDGPEATTLQELGESLGIAERVRFLGHLTDPYPAMGAFDIYVQPSIEEGFGIAVLEAMALGLPIVATRAGGLPEIVEDGVTGFLVAPGDAGALSAAIGRLLDNAPARDAAGIRGKGVVEARFDAKAVANSYATAYARLLGGR